MHATINPLLWGCYFSRSHQHSMLGSCNRMAEVQAVQQNKSPRHQLPCRGNTGQSWEHKRISQRNHRTDSPTDRPGSTARSFLLYYRLRELKGNHHRAYYTTAYWCTDKRCVSCGPHKERSQHLQRPTMTSLEVMYSQAQRGPSCVHPITLLLSFPKKNKSSGMLGFQSSS